MRLTYEKRPNYYVSFDSVFKPRTLGGKYNHIPFTLQANGLPETEEGLNELNRRLKAHHEANMDAWREQNQGADI